MSVKGIEKLAERWIAGQLAWETGTGFNPPAIDAVITLGFDLRPNHCALLWRFILEVTKQSGDPEVVEILGASPLEDLIRNHGDEFLERIENESRTNPRLRSALRHVWITDAEDPRYVRLGCYLLPSSR